jgi:hypothetical protein
MKSELLLALFKSVSSLPAFGKFIKRTFDNANCCCVPALLCPCREPTESGQRSNLGRVGDCCASLAMTKKMVRITRLLNRAYLFQLPLERSLRIITSYDASASFQQMIAHKSRPTVNDGCVSIQDSFEPRYSKILTLGNVCPAKVTVASDGCTSS